MKSSVFLLLFSYTQVVCGRSTYRNRIPNGSSVPNPEITRSVWAGVGHYQAGGGGQRNQFGVDFAASGFEWTVELCQKDSDGDGRSNGEELGDPECVWKEGEDPPFPAESHPGIVDHKIDPTVAIADTCKDYEPPRDIQVMDIKFNRPSQLDGSRTQYICEQFHVESPQSGVYYFHQIKNEPLVDNTDVLHHIWIYSCDGTSSSDGDRVGQGSYGCNGVEGNCQIVAGWALGGGDLCEPASVGSALNFGSTVGGSMVFKVEAHYDNALGRPTTDQSGMRMHLTSTLRPQESGMIILGMDYWDRQFELEANRDLVSRSNICPTAATMLLQHPIWIYQWNPHMHLYGKSLVTEHYRCGQKIGEIGRISHFEFDNQQNYVFDPPVKILPGDALVTTCSFNTSNAQEPVIGGEETTQEMCDNYVSYYPSVWTKGKPNLFSVCNSYEKGIRPELIGYDDTSPFVMLDTAGDHYITNYDSDPRANVAPCCSNGGAANCEAKFLAAKGEACGVDFDCKSGMVCQDGLCKVTSNQERKAGNSTTEVEVQNQQPSGRESGAGKAWGVLPCTFCLALMVAIF